MRRLLACLALITACHGSDDAPPGPAGVPVTLGTVRRDSLAVTIEADARLISPPTGVAVLSAPADAMVRSVRVQLGTRVRAGTDVVELEAPELEASARGLRAQAIAAMRDAERQRQLLAEGIAARREAEEREAAAQALSAQADAAEALAQRTRLRAPLAGVVTQLHVRPGERVSAGAPLAEVVDPSQVYVAASVPAAQLLEARTGQAGMLTVEGSDREWPVEVSQLGATVDSVSNTGTVLLRLKTTDGSLRPGLAGRVRIQVALHPNVLIVPAQALVYAGDEPTVFVVGPDSVARARAVVPGARDGEDLEVEGALEPGQMVVVTGAYGLPDSTRVIPQQPSAP